MPTLVPFLPTVKKEMTLLMNCRAILWLARPTLPDLSSMNTQSTLRTQSEEKIMIIKKKNVCTRSTAVVYRETKLYAT